MVVFEFFFYPSVGIIGNAISCQDAIKASAGGLFALCALYPLDLLRTKRAAESSTSNENSKKSIWQNFAFMMREK